MSLSNPVDSEFFRMLMAEEGGNVKELLDAEEYLVPQPGGIFSTQGEMRANGPSRHHSHRVRDNFILSLHLVIIYALLLFQTCFCFCWTQGEGLKNVHATLCSDQGLLSSKNDTFQDAMTHETVLV